MTLLTLGQAAKATGRSKAGILDAIKNGRLSASRDEKKQWQIDPAELHRVYPIVELGVQSVRELTPEKAEVLRHSEEKITYLERIISTLEREREEMRHRLYQSEEERRQTQTKLTALLTHQASPQPETTQTAPVHKSFWQKLLG